MSFLFTRNQRNQLQDFFNTNIIPDRLFNGDEVGETSAQERIMMSSVILSEGVYQPGSYLQQVQARMCGHFVKLTWHYAGVTPSGNAEWSGIMGNLDHDGNILIGNGRQESIYSGLGSNRTYLNNVSEGQLGEFAPEGTSYAEGYEGASEERRARYHRNKAMPYDRFDDLQTGDWLYYFNGNRSASGDHSVVFSRWVSGEQDAEGIRFRRAAVFSGSTNSVGHEHQVNLGAQFRLTDPKICPITKVSRVSQDAQPADSVLDVLGGSMTEDGAELSWGNRKYLRRFRRRHRAELDIHLLSQDLRNENTRLIEELSTYNQTPESENDRSGSERVTQGQLTLLREANSEDHVENLVRLTQRLRVLTNNIRIHDENTERLYVTGRPAIQGRRAARIGLNEQYEISRQETEERLAELRAQIEELDQQIEPKQEEIDRIESQIDELGQNEELSRIRRRLNQSYTEMLAMTPRSPERQNIMKERRALQDRRRVIQTETRGNRGEIRDLNRLLNPLKRKIRPLKNRRRRLESQEEQVQGSDPRGHAHAGNVRSGVDRRSRFNGDIESVKPYATSGNLALRESRMEW